MIPLFHGSRPRLLFLRSLYAHGPQLSTKREFQPTTIYGLRAVYEPSPVSTCFTKCMYARMYNKNTLIRATFLRVCAQFLLT